MLSLQRARMPHHLLSLKPDDSRGMLRELPFNTIGDVGCHGLELHFYCSRCYATLDR
jgi:hypothetical protein